MTKEILEMKVVTKINFRNIKQSRNSLKIPKSNCYSVFVNNIFVIFNEVL